MSYLNETKIQAIADICTEFFTDENKNTLKKIGKKHGLTFCENTGINANMLWKLGKTKLMNDPTRRLRNGKTVQESQTGVIIENKCVMGYNLMEFNDNINTHIQDYINENFKTDYDFICGFQISKFYELIKEILSSKNNYLILLY
jgi:hypothetical protein